MWTVVIFVLSFGTFSPSPPDTGIKTSNALYTDRVLYFVIPTNNQSRCPNSSTSENKSKEAGDHVSGWSQCQQESMSSTLRDRPTPSTGCHETTHVRACANEPNRRFPLLANPSWPAPRFHPIDRMPLRRHVKTCANQPNRRLPLLANPSWPPPKFHPPGHPHPPLTPKLLPRCAPATSPPRLCRATSNCPGTLSTAARSACHRFPPFVPQLTSWQSLVQTRLHFQNVVAGFTPQDEEMLVDWKLDLTPRTFPAADAARRGHRGKEHGGSAVGESAAVGGRETKGNDADDDSRRAKSGGGDRT